MKAQDLEYADLLTIKNCLIYCKHRLIDHKGVGLVKTGCQVEHIDRTLKELGFEIPRKKIEPFKEIWCNLNECVGSLIEKVNEIIRAVNLLSDKIGGEG